MTLRHGDKTKLKNLTRDMRELREQHGTVTKDMLKQRGHSTETIRRLGDLAREGVRGGTPMGSPQ